MSRKLTDEQREEIVFEYLEGFETTVSLAEKYGVNHSTISRVINSSETLAKLEKKASISAQRAKIRAQLNADEIMRLMIEDANKTREDKFGHLHQNARRDVLDRAGVRTTEKEDATLTVRFADGMGFNIGETEDVQIVEAGEE